MPITFTPDPALYPFTSRWFDSTRGRMHYVDEGTGPPLLMCHGNPTWSFLYRNIITALRDRFRCIAVDHLGFGLSERPTGFGYTATEHVAVLGELIDHLELDGYLSFGQDWGGPISLGAAVDRPDRVAGAILGNTWFWPADTVSMKAFSMVMSSPPLQYAITRHNFFVNRLIPSATAHKLSPQVMAHYRDVQPTPQDRVGVAQLPKEIRAAHPLLARLATEVPDKLGDKKTLIVWGMHDPAFRPWMLKRVRAAFADQVYVALPHASHFIQEDAPDEIAAAITERFG
ncbi:haloalkane dehalogenase [Mycobacterium sp. M1]|uniref:Haloalkane dehalogenase n=1 Tax=Mycolicibacter acidiphilus TaxID=2835306 RepID=A0ABS5RN84_9MYCO|nr:haloalkane dehalogenase [Mycolicibacter acidiphilus]MBS9535482.1 haloalkane dehalogenase [Mycolicibacter acidiphilus]